MPFSKNNIIIGAGPAGMGCAYALSGAGRPFLVIESEGAEGGLCRTIDFQGCLFDIGGHRFLSGDKEVNALWRSVMGDDLLRVRRLSSIYNGRIFYRYPPAFCDIFSRFGIIKSIACAGSYIYSKISHPGDDGSFEGWVVNRFGKRLYELFFRGYTEKVWGMPCRDISSRWARQRIPGLSVRALAERAVFGGGNSPRTMSGEFFYPATGPGEFYRRLGRMVSGAGGEFLLESRVVKIRHDNRKIIAVEVEGVHTGARTVFSPGYLFSSMPLTALVKSLHPAAPDAIIEAAGRLQFRDFITVNVILNKDALFPEQWIYVHSPEVRMGRIQNYKNWSSYMVPDAGKTSLGLEYFCSSGDDIWNMKDADLIGYAVDELSALGIASSGDLIGGSVVRCPNAYPVYRRGYSSSVKTIRDYLSRFSNLRTIGRGGTFRYDNSDQALLNGIYAARGLLE